MLGIYRKIPHKKWPAYELLELEEGYINISDFSIKNMGWWFTWKCPLSQSFVWYFFERDHKFRKSVFAIDRLWFDNKGKWICKILLHIEIIRRAVQFLITNGASFC